MANLKCDSCYKEFELKVKIKKHTRLIEETYFKCPHCKERYSSYFTDEHIRSKQDQINLLWKQLKNSRDDKETSDLVVKIDNIKSEIKDDMVMLKSVMTKVKK